jgi:hypothetical protein
MHLFLSAFLLLCCSGCASLLGAATDRLAENVSRAIVNQDDVATVRDGAPAYLLMLDGLIDGDPESEALLLGGARLYGAYASAFVTDPARAKRLAAKAKEYGTRALCRRGAALCAAAAGPAASFLPLLARLDRDDVPALYGFGAAWAGWIQANADDWSAVAELPKVAAVMQRVVELDEKFDDGAAHLYLGVLDTQLPPALGGKPEQGRAHFERALALSQGRNLMVKVLYAKQYARLVFDRELHDRLLKEVLAADPRVPGLTLNNVLAQEQAKELLASGDQYF